MGIRLRHPESLPALVEDFTGRRWDRDSFGLLLASMGTDGVHDEPASSAVYHMDLECIYSGEDYVAIIEDLATRLVGVIGIADIRSEVYNQRAWVEFTADGRPVHVDLEVQDDWADLSFLRPINQRLAETGSKQLYIAGLAQDLLIVLLDRSVVRDFERLTHLRVALP